MKRLPRPISAASVHDWCAVHGLDIDETTAFRRLIDAMDAEHIAWLADQAEPAAADTAAQD